MNWIFENFNIIFIKLYLSYICKKIFMCPTLIISIIKIIIWQKKLSDVVVKVSLSLEDLDSSLAYQTNPFSNVH